MRIRESLLFLLLAFLPTMMSAQRPGEYIKRPKTQQNTGGQKEKQRHKTAAISAERRQRILDNLINNMVYVEGGTFTMGATPEQGSDAEDREKPAHRVTLSSFFIGKYEVTQEEWQTVMGNNPSLWKDAKRPVENVSWEDCQAFIIQLNAMTARNFRLPTEAEWEYAARGGKYSKGYKYAGSNDVGSVAWYFKNRGMKTSKVGLKHPNELGLYDMSGNVREWCQDWEDYYSDDSQANSIDSLTESFRALRGGGWDNGKSCRVTSRLKGALYVKSDDNGMRLAL